MFAFKKPSLEHKKSSAFFLTDDGVCTPVDAGISAMIEDGWRMKGEIERLETNLAEINEMLCERFDADFKLTIPNLVSVRVGEREMISISDPENLKVILGARFDDLVKTEVKYKPEPKLKGIAHDTDHPMHSGVASCLTVEVSKKFVTWRAEKH